MSEDKENRINSDHQEPTIIEVAVETGANIVAERTKKPLLVVLDEVEKESIEKGQTTTANVARNAKKKLTRG